ncbi:hypothetical protein VNO77_15739 [Canavalia gladiata]|uniref:Uncharacterized protein n=1 Tax=Canavalia gladiata TaxID=3824 RepID=A0AAN9QRD2_CANGL
MDSLATTGNCTVAWCCGWFWYFLIFFQRIGPTPKLIIGFAADAVGGLVVSSEPRGLDYCAEILLGNTEFITSPGVNDHLEDPIFCEPETLKLADVESTSPNPSLS